MLITSFIFSYLVLGFLTSVTLLHFDVGSRLTWKRFILNWRYVVVNSLLFPITLFYGMRDSYPPFFPKIRY